MDHGVYLLVQVQFIVNNQVYIWLLDTFHGCDLKHVKCWMGWMAKSVNQEMCRTWALVGKHC